MLSVPYNGNYNRAITLAPERGLYWHAKASVYFEMGRAGQKSKHFHKALECMLKAAEFSPRNVSVLLAVTRTYSAFKDTAKMFEWFDKTVAVDPTHKEVKEFGRIVTPLREQQQKTIKEYEDLQKELKNVDKKKPVVISISFF